MNYTGRELDLPDSNLGIGAIQIDPRHDLVSNSAVEDRCFGLEVRQRKTPQGREDRCRNLYELVSVRDGRRPAEGPKHDYRVYYGGVFAEQLEEPVPACCRRSRILYPGGFRQLRDVRCARTQILRRCRFERETSAPVTSVDDHVNKPPRRRPLWIQRPAGRFTGASKRRFETLKSERLQSRAVMHRKRKTEVLKPWGRTRDPGLRLLDTRCWRLLKRVNNPGNEAELRLGHPIQLRL